MDLTSGNTDEKIRRSKKTMLWFAMISMTMVFAGLTSAFVVSKSRRDWGIDFQFPTAFFWGFVVMLSSSACLLGVKQSVRKGNRLWANLLILASLLLGITFILLQFLGFSQIIAQGYHLTGPTSNIVSTFIFVIAFTHILHVAGGIVVLLVLLFNLFSRKYEKGNTLGLELGMMYWHFVDVLWIYLFAFLYFFR